MERSDLITKDVLICDLQSAGITKGALLHLKVSLKSIGQVQGGADTLLDAILEVVGAEGTLVVDSFITSYPLPLSTEHAKIISTEKSPSYAGVFANAMIKHPLSVRSQHPIQRFTAIGARAHELMDTHTPESGGYDVMEKLAELGALNLSIGEKTVGVGTTHVAIERMGHEKKSSNMGLNYLAADGTTKLFKVNWSGGCSRGFVKFIPLYEKNGFLKRVKIGKAQSIVTNMKGTLAVEEEKLKEDSSFFFCDDPTCKDCRLNWSHSTGNYWKVKFYSLLSILGWNRY